MAGHTIALYLSESGYNVTITTRNPIILYSKIKKIIWKGDFKDLENIILLNHWDIIINAVGILNTNCDINPHLAILMNSYLPHFLVNLTKEIKTKIIQLSTDCVFSGKKGEYTELDIKDGATFYDKTKILGEFDNNKKDIIFRNSIIGPDLNNKGLGLFNWFMNQQKEINGFDNWYWSGITTLELAKNIKYAIENNFFGLYHLTNNLKISKYELLENINKNFNKKIIINKTSLKNVIDKSLINTKKIKYFKIQSYDEMIDDMFKWIKKHNKLYNHYKIGD